MQTIRPLIIKYIYIAAITIVFLTYLQIPSVPLGTSLIVALFLTPALYLAGERYLLPQFGTVATAIGSFVIAAIILSLANTFVREPITTGVILSASAIMGIAEWFYFRYILSDTAPVMEGGYTNPLAETQGAAVPENSNENINQHSGDEHNQQQGQTDQPEQPRNEG